MGTSAGNADEVVRELRRTRRNRYAVTTFFAALGILASLSIDLTGSGSGFVTPIFSALMVIPYYARYRSRRREWTSVEDFAEIGNALREVRASNQTTLFGYEVASNGWFIKTSSMSLDYFSARDICWAYPTQTKVSTYGVHTETRHGVTVVLSTGKSIASQVETKGFRSRNKMSTATMDDLQYVQRIAPWAVFGYNEGLARRWKSDRKGFLSEVAGRRDAITKSWSVAGPKPGLG